LPAWADERERDLEGEVVDLIANLTTARVWMQANQAWMLESRSPEEALLAPRVDRCRWRQVALSSRRDFIDG
jgi:hypothetical protein